MKLLVIETTGPMASVALIDENRNTTERTNDTLYSHLEELVPMISALLAQSDTPASSLAAIGVSRGPGSFTGIRIGLVTAKALAQIWEKPIIEIPTLEGFAYHEAHPVGSLIVPVLDARRGQIYAGAYRKTDDYEVSEEIGENVWNPDDFLKRLAHVQSGQDTVRFCGDGTVAYAAMLQLYEKPYEFASGDEAFQRGRACAQLALNLFLGGRTSDAFSAEPVYLRASEAERKRKERCAT